MNITSISHHPIRVGGSLAAALLVAGLQLSLVALPIGSLRASGANEERNAFTLKNLQSDIAGVADRTDPNLVNSWGLVINPTASIFWVADNGTGPEPPKRVSKIVYQNRRPLRLDRKMLINATVSAKTTVFEWDSIGFEEPVYEREGR